MREKNLYRAILRAVVETHGRKQTADYLIAELIEWDLIDANDPEIFEFENTWEEMVNERDGV